MNTVLTQEVIRYNRLLVLMQQTLVDVKKALKGTILLSEELEFLSNSLYDNQVPVMWSTVGFLSMKPLASWINDLEKRCTFL
jgi:dynein heavy chain